jgi:signal transduction histidine kinase
MAIMGALTVFVIQLDIRYDQHRSMLKMTGEMAAVAVANERRLPQGADLGRWLNDLAFRYKLNDRNIMFMMDSEGRIIQQFPPSPPEEVEQLAFMRQEIMKDEPHIFALESYRDRSPFLVAVHPMAEDSGYMLLLLPEANLLQSFREFRVPRLILAFILILTGWGVIYVLTRRLVKPIQNIVEAAQQVVAGNYDMQLDKVHREREIFELMDVFQEMTDRLKWLESLRTQLLAGVTHELKTPVASISGLIQAVKAGVVTGQEADKFLGMSLKECRRLQKMVEDLLDFNSFAGNTMTVSAEACDLKALVPDIIERWRHGLDEDCPRISFEAEAEAGNWKTMTDPIRLEQIVINLLNNAKAAIGPAGELFISLSVDSTYYLIQVKDTGHGIPTEEQLDIFEPFYRGKRKKTKVRGLGLGLPFSRLIARSLGGDLVLSDSSPAGTVFTLQIPFRKLSYDFQYGISNRGSGVN